MEARTRMRRAKRRGWSIFRVDEAGARWAALREGIVVLADTRNELLDKVEKKERENA